FELAVKGGWIMIVLALLSIIGIYIFFERFSTLRNAMKRNPLFMDRIHDNIKDDDLKSAANYCRSENTPLSRIIEKGVKSFDFSASSIRESVDNSANLEIANLEKGLPILSTIAAVAPMIGFLGTVTGMVRAFWEMANAGNNIDVSLLSGGIYEAMITTVGGLIVGIIAIFAYNYLVALVDKVQNDLEAEIISFMEIVREKKEL
ncbi:MAG: MotA/TolQ/ExbB proton channel family protein, partial [Bacteroidaceae bacterium]|nr:MotA/TolQ/ExbB proton channel family protein [Bacteroidaceae bacterium]